MNIKKSPIVLGFEVMLVRVCTFPKLKPYYADLVKVLLLRLKRGVSCVIAVEFSKFATAKQLRSKQETPLTFPDLIYYKKGWD